MLDRLFTVRAVVRYMAAVTALAVLSSCPLGAWAAPPPGEGKPRPNIILITLDTTRADHLGVYGYDLDTTPNLDRFAKKALVFERVTATGNWTLTSHASLMTGKLPTGHGANFDPDGWMILSSALDGPYDDYRVRPLGAEQVTLAERLRDAGYLTGVVVDGPWLKRQFGMDQGFTFYDDDGITSANGRPATEVTDRALAWLDQGGDAPRFLFLNYFDAHGPLVQPRRAVERFLRPGHLLLRKEFAAQARELAEYDAEISFVDFHLGRLLQGLRKRNLLQNSWIIVTADHGELFGEHGATGHGGNPPYREVTRIPLIVKEPGLLNGDRSDRPMQLTDIAPMLLDAVALPLLASTDGSAADRGTKPIITEAQTIQAHGDVGDWLALEEDGKKLIWHSRGNHLLFDVRADPSEARNLAGDQPEVVEAMSKRLVEYLAGVPKPTERREDARIDSETEESLRALGYLR